MKRFKDDQEYFKELASKESSQAQKLAVSILYFIFSPKNVLQASEKEVKNSLMKFDKDMKKG